MNVLLLDNYDSFTYNLYQIIVECGVKNVEVVRNDKIKMQDIEQFDKIVLSPGPGIPEEAGMLLPIVKRYAASKSMLGVCLGHQAIAETFGCTLENLKNVYHGVQTPIITHADEPVFKGMGEVFPAGRYHSWVVSKKNFPSCLEITALSKEGYIMGLRHVRYDLHGIQFHPESILTPDGKKIIKNFLTL